jgi:nanoRNase/pAp phosphatase (c-di-AMP/oligoRNAs hydrolase)
MTNQTETAMKEYINSAKNILIVCQNNANDSLATGISLAKYIEKVDSKVPELVFKGDMSFVDPYLLSLHTVKESIEPRTLKIALNYKDTNIQTLNWHKDENNGNIVFEILPVEKEFDMNRITHSFSGGEYDLIITIGVKSLADLDDLYIRNKAIFESAKIVNIDTSNSNTSFGHLNIIDTKVDSLSGLIFSKFAEWNYIPDKDIVKSLLVGIAKS